MATTSNSFAMDTGDKVNYRHKFTHSVSVFSADGGYVGGCAAYGVPHDPITGTATVTRLSNNSKIAKAVYQYGIVQGWSGNLDNFRDWDGVTKHSALSFMTQISQMGYDNWYEKCAYSDSAKRIIKDLYDEASGFSAAPDNFEIYFCNTGNSNLQNFLLWRVVPTGKMRLKKVSSNTSISG